MANPQKPAPTSKTTTPAAAPTPPAKNGNGMSAAQAKSETSGKTKKPKVWLSSPQDPSFRVRCYKSVLEIGTPKDPWGNTMVPAVGRAGGGNVEALKKAKEERDAKLAAMTEEARVAFLKAESEQKKANRAAKKQAEYDAIVAKVKADVLAGKL